MLKHLKQIGTLLLCGLLFMRVMVAPVIFLQYEFNKEYIIKNYCINKNRPEMHCDGKCYLAKKLKAAEQNEDNQSKIQVFKLMIEVYQQACASFSPLTTITPSHTLACFVYSNVYHYKFLFSMLKPPREIV
ncbi:hypothetical protein [Emticicia sp. 21SJ11W-3]|uniref:hypothetical protein n=1 Tax=Emticicia sp. 21SJ11W-3 TaxID=2916755 RepID=UPI0020A16CFC|nr:hypothetical protein [Emticicia sp. 21SJ11W-3]UTA66347.1 hypothetical protein MB380_12110 [Emticicia sp. 21SJ11W-3]